MKNYSSIIIDDETKLQKGLKIQLENLCPQIEVLGCANNAKEGYTLITQKQPDLLFLDISMPGETGFDLLDYFETISFEIIFVTGFSEYIKDALRLSAVDYLEKPIKDEELEDAVKRAIDRIENRKDIERYKVLKDNLQNLGSSNNRIAVFFENEIQFVKVADIIRFEGWQNCTKIHLANAKVLNRSLSIGKFEDRLKNYNFYRVHRSHLINVDEIDTYRKEGFVVMSDSSEVPVANDRRKDFLDYINGALQ